MLGFNKYKYLLLTNSSKKQWIYPLSYNSHLQFYSSWMLWFYIILYRSFSPVISSNSLSLFMLCSASIRSFSFTAVAFIPNLSLQITQINVCSIYLNGALIFLKAIIKYLQDHLKLQNFGIIISFNFYSLPLKRMSQYLKQIGFMD